MLKKRSGLHSKTMFRNGELRFYEDKVFTCDSNVFRVFTHPFIEGNPKLHWWNPTPWY